MKKKFFTAGPAELYPRYTEFVNTFLELQLGSLSHRSSQFKKIYQFTVEQLRELMDIPNDNTIMFTGSASEIWEKSIQSLVEFESFHLVNGSFSEKYFQYSQALHKKATSFRKPAGMGFSYSEINVPEYAELVCITQNETSTGVQIPEIDIHKLKRSNQNKLFSVDIVSSAPIPALDFTLIDTAFFSVQKNFGMPAGLGVWIANEKCYQRALDLKDKSTVAHHDLPTLWENAISYQNPATPNVMAIYILGKIAEDMNKTGINQIRKTNQKNSKLLYDFFQKHENFKISVEEPSHRSKTVAVIDTKNNSKDIIYALEKQGYELGSGYGKMKDQQIRISNFISNSTEDIESLLNEIEKI